MTVFAPYNFVPLSGKVVPAPDVDQISHDKPAPDGVSGLIEVRVEATTELCVGGHHEDSIVRPFQTPDGVYAIQGTAFKGMLRNVVEIITFSRMALVDRDRRYAVRDLHNKDAKLYRGHMTNDNLPRKDGKRVFGSKVRGGWLRRDGDGWFIEPCLYARVEQSDLLRSLGAESGALRQAFQAGRSLADKYEAWDQVRSSRSLKFELDRREHHKMSSGKGWLRFRRAQPMAKGSVIGDLVMTGQVNREKHREFIFYGSAGAPVRLQESVVSDFQLNHSEALGQRHTGQAEPNTEWGYWKARFDRGERVPVFYLPSANGSGVKSFGLAQMYRLAYDYTVGHTIDAASVDHDPDPEGFEPKMDFAEAMFGKVVRHRSSGDSFKGRIDVGLLRAEGRPRLTGPYRATLGAPKGTWYPAYLRQGDRGYKTYQDADAEARGWKRYPVREDNGRPRLASGNTVSTWHALDKGTVFRGRIRVHNLRRVELGALLWALDFGGQPELRHSLGYARPFGFGAVKVEVSRMDLRAHGPAATTDVSEAVKAFTAAMDTALATDQVYPWAETPQLFQLQAMADPRRASKADLRYMSIGHGDGGQRGNQFTSAKKGNAALPSYAMFNGKPDESRYKRTTPEVARAERIKQEEAERAKLEAERAKLEAERAKLEAEHAMRAEAEREAKRRQSLGALGRVDEDFGAWQRLKAAEQADKMLEHFGSYEPGQVPLEEVSDPQAWLVALRGAFAEAIEELRIRVLGSDPELEQSLAEAEADVARHLDAKPRGADTRTLRRWKKDHRKLKARAENLQKQRGNQRDRSAGQKDGCQRLLIWLEVK